VFSKFGKVTKLDFLFHKTGLLKGKPRGYAFVEYGNKDVSSFVYPLLGGGDHDADTFAISLGRSQSFDDGS
jgi:RNA recognition motif. (a.k.a. RRM, RBD, or RNP domain)